MPSNILLQDAISQCGNEFIRTIKDAISPFEDHKFAQHIISNLNDDSSAEAFLQLRLAPSIVCRSEIELYSIYMPRFGIRVDLGGDEGFGFLTFRRSNLLQKELIRAYEKHPEILEKLKVTENSRYGKLADSVIRIPEIYTDTEANLKSIHSINFWNVAQAKLFKHYGEYKSASGIPFVTHSDSSGGLCAQACLFMLEMYHIDQMDRINGIADITYLAGTNPQGSGNTNSISLKGLEPERIYDYVKKICTEKIQNEDSARILSVHNLPDRNLKNENKGPLVHLSDCFRELGKSPRSDEMALQIIEVEAYARSLIPQLALVDAGLLSQKNIYPPSELSGSSNQRRPHAILVVGTRYSVNPDTGVVHEYMIFNDPATGPLRAIDPKFSLVECARYTGLASDKTIKNDAAFESLAILPKGMARHLTPKQPGYPNGPLRRRKDKSIKHFTVGILEDLQLQQDLEIEDDILKKIILMAIQFPPDEEVDSRFQTILLVLAATVLSKLNIKVNSQNEMFFKHLSDLIEKYLIAFKEKLNVKKTQNDFEGEQPNPENQSGENNDMENRKWYWLLCIPRLKRKQIHIHLRLYSASDDTLLTDTENSNAILKAIDKGDFSVKLS